MSCTRLVSLLASWRIRPANRLTASGSSAASSTVSASSASAPTGVLSSWLVLATKSLRTSSTRRRSVWSSTSSKTSPPPPTPGPSGATLTAKLVVLPFSAAGGDVDLTLADLAVPADLTGECEQFSYDKLFPFDQPEGAGGLAGL